MTSFAVDLKILLNSSMYSCEFKLSAKPFHDSISLVRRLSSFGNRLIVFELVPFFLRNGATKGEGAAHFNLVPCC
jgi:hypothetical protein